MINLIAYTGLQLRVLKTGRNTNQIENEPRAHDLIKYWVRLLTYMADLRKNRVDKNSSHKIVETSEMCTSFGKRQLERVPSIFPKEGRRGHPKKTKTLKLSRCLCSKSFQDNSVLAAADLPILISHMEVSDHWGHILASLPITLAKIRRDHRLPFENDVDTAQTEIRKCF